MNDSVLVQDGGGQERPLSDTFAEVNAWLSEEAASSP